MKMKKYLLLIVAFFALLTTKAQIVNVCGTDTITLQVQNYENGIIEWQESLDNIIWVTIPDAVGTKYKFFPTETKYYRAQVKTSTCEPLYSDTSLVQLPPTSYAGSDKEVGGNTTILLGNDEVAANGEWSIIAGNGGNILEPINPYSRFTGSFGEEYLLVWTVTNGCGQVTDTVSVIFEEIIAKDNFIVVDMTDSIYSDSTEMASGLYRIRFSDSSIVPFDSCVIIGMREDISFIRNVQSFVLIDSVYHFTTTEGSLEDVIESGSANIGDAVNESIIERGNERYSKFPTRETLKMYSKNKGQVMIYCSDFVDDDGIIINYYRNSIKPNGLKLSLPNMDIFKSPDGNIKLSIENTYVRIQPNFVCQFKIGFFCIKNIKIGLDNGEFEYNYKLKIEAKVEKEWESKKKEFLKVENNVVFMLGPVPVLISSKFSIKAQAKINASAKLLVEESKNYQKNFTALLKGNRLKNVKWVCYSSEKSTHETKVIVQGSLGAEFSIGPEISVELYKVIGPYFALPLKLGAELCVNNNSNWKAEASLKIEGYIGIRAHLGKLELFDVKKKLFSKDLLKPLELPSKIEIDKGNFQSGLAGTTLPVPITVKVTSSYGFGIPLAPVRFEVTNGNGIVSKTIDYTDASGKASVNWTLGSNPENVLKIYVLDCEDENIKNSPLYVYANTTNSPNLCANNDLNITINSTSSTYTPIATGGKTPYLYSTNNVDYSATIPTFNNTNIGEHTFYVKDNNACKTSKTFSIDGFDPCLNSNLTTETFAQSNIVKFIGLNGLSPYQFSVDNENNFSADSIYNNLLLGEHMVYIKDANNCIDSSSFEVDGFIIPAITAEYPVDGANFIPANGVTFAWIAGEYAEEQKIDLYLKLENNAFVLIASNLIDTSYYYSNTLVNAANYSWKIVVKDQNGVEKDSRIFTFKVISAAPAIPSIPNLASPANLSLLPDYSTTLTWNSQVGDFKYDVYLDTKNPPSIKANNLTTNELVVNNLIPGKTYYWKVKIKSLITGEIKESVVWSFDTKQLVLPVPNIISHNTFNGTTYYFLVVSNLNNIPGGICWALHPNPSINDYISEFANQGTYNLPAEFDYNKTYYVRTFARYQSGISYGDTISVTTPFFIDNVIYNSLKQVINFTDFEIDNNKNIYMPFLELESNEPPFIIQPPGSLLLLRGKFPNPAISVIDNDSNIFYGAFSKVSDSIYSLTYSKNNTVTNKQEMVYSKVTADTANTPISIWDDAYGGQWQDMAVGSDNTIHTIYQKADSTTSLRYQSKNGMAAFTLPIDLKENSSKGKIIIDANNIPHVVAQGTTGLIHFTNGVPETIHANVVLTAKPQVFYKTLDTLVVFYTNNAGNSEEPGIYMATKIGNNPWIKTIIDSISNPMSLSAVMMQDNTFRIVSLNQSKNLKYYTSISNTAWNKKTLFEMMNINIDINNIDNSFPRMKVTYDNEIFITYSVFGEIHLIRLR